jgi:hypothetical protein
MTGVRVPRFSNKLFRAARISRNLEVLASGNPLKMARRAANIMIGRKVARRLFLKGSRKKKGNWLS